MNKLIELFLNEHKQINKLFQDIISETNSKTKRDEIIVNLKQVLFKHFMEEEILYGKYQYDFQQTVMTINRLKSEHKLMREAFKKTDVDIKKIYTMLKIHEHIETSTLYPELEKHVSAYDMAQIEEKIIVNLNQ